MNTAPPENSPETQEESTESPVMVAARQYFMELAKNSDKLRTDMQAAKTRTKKNYFHKKLQRNNNEAIGLLQRIDGLAQSKAIMGSAEQIAAKETQVDDEYR